MSGIMRYFSRGNRSIRQVMSFLRGIDAETRRFRGKTGLGCPEGCGLCCEKTGIEAAALEFLPLAAWIHKKNMADEMLAKIEKADAASVCIFYKSDGIVPGNGRCGVYPLRGMICRLFGFSVSKDKYGKLKVATCSLLKRTRPDIVKKAQETLDSGCKARAITSFSTRLAGISPGHDTELMPINLAIKAAIEKTGWLFSREKV